MQDPKPLEVPDTVEEGGLLLITVRSGSTEVSLVVPGVGLVDLPVVNGRAEYRLPPNAPAGRTIVVSDNANPVPTGASVLITSSDP